MEKITIKNFADMLCDKVFLTKGKTLEVIETFINTLVSEVKNGKVVYLNDFGKFALKTKKEKNGRNPKTGESILIPAKTFLKFYPVKELKNIK